MYQKCRYLRQRTKKGELYYYCAKHRENVEFCCYRECLDKEYKEQKKIKKKNHYNEEKKRYSILTNDLKHCIVCGRTGVNIHEVYFGRNRQNSIKNGFCIPLCEELHHNQYDCKGIHFDIELDLHYKKLMQLKFEETHTRDEFMDIIGRNYL